MERFLPETQGNLCGEHTVGSGEPALAYRQITGRDGGGRVGRVVGVEEDIHYCGRETGPGLETLERRQVKGRPQTAP